MQCGILKFLTHTILGHWLPSWILFSHLMKLAKLQTTTLCTATRRCPFFFFLTKRIQDGQKVLVIEHIIHFFVKLDCSVQISMCFLNEYYQRKIVSLGVFLVSIQPRLHLLQSNQAFRVALSSTVYYAAWLINSLPIGAYYSTQPGSTTGLLGNMEARLAGTSLCGVISDSHFVAR